MPARTTVPSPVPNPQPIQFTAFTKKDFESDAGIARLNLLLSQYTPIINQLLGAAGPTVLPSGVDVRGARISGLSAPQSESDAISAGHANTQYGAEAVSPQLDIGGKQTLKGLAYCFQQVQLNGPAIAAIQKALAAGVSGTIALAKLTGGGANGSITVTGGIITGFVNPT